MSVTVRFLVSLSRVSAQTVSVDYHTTDGVGATEANGDYMGVSGTLTWLPGELTKYIPVQVNDSEPGESEEKFRMTLLNPVNATFEVGGSEGECTIVGHPTVATPVIDATSTAVPKSIVITVATAGASIRYTTNGDTPTGASTLYTGPFDQATSATIKAIGIKSGLTNSSVASVNVTVVGAVAIPVASPVAGDYTGTQSVTLTTSTAGASIYYTTDGSTPDITKTLYSGPISLPGSTVLKAIGIKSGSTSSPVSSDIYVITPYAYTIYSASPPIDYLPTGIDFTSLVGTGYSTLAAARAAFEALVPAGSPVGNTEGGYHGTDKNWDGGSVVTGYRIESNYDKYVLEGADGAWTISGTDTSPVVGLALSNPASRGDSGSKGAWLCATFDGAVLDVDGDYYSAYWRTPNVWVDGEFPLQFYVTPRATYATTTGIERGLMTWEPYPGATGYSFYGSNRDTKDTSYYTFIESVGAGVTSHAVDMTFRLPQLTLQANAFLLMVAHTPGGDVYSSHSGVPIYSSEDSYNGVDVGTRTFDNTAHTLVVNWLEDTEGYGDNEPANVFVFAFATQAEAENVDTWAAHYNHAICAANTLTLDVTGIVPDTSLGTPRIYVQVFSIPPTGLGKKAFGGYVNAT